MDTVCGHNEIYNLKITIYWKKPSAKYDGLVVNLIMIRKNMNMKTITLIFKENNNAKFQYFDFAFSQLPISPEKLICIHIYIFGGRGILINSRWYFSPDSRCLRTIIWRTYYHLLIYLSLQWNVFVFILMILNHITTEALY